MTNKLKLTTALAGSLMVLGSVSANAQTYYKDGISGNLAISYQAVKTEIKANSFRQFGKESQINLAASGSLNNGWTYKAGTSLEMDGGDGLTSVVTANSTNTWGAGALSANTTQPTVAGTQAAQAENTFIDFINGNTTISISTDHLNASDTHMTNLVGFGYIGADGINNLNSLYPKNISNYQAYGIGVIQKTAIGSFFANYTPHNNNSAAGNDIFNVTNKAAGGTANSAYELNYLGNLGLNGLTVLGSYVSFPKAGITTGGVTLDGTASRVAAKYNFGQFTAAIDRSREENMQANAATTAGTQKFNGDSYAVAYAINKELSVGATYAEAKSNTVNNPKKESTVVLAVGYNLGPVALSTQYKNVQNLSGTAQGDGQSLGFYANTLF
jgi:hypothetical protein